MLGEECLDGRQQNLNEGLARRNALHVRQCDDDLGAVIAALDGENERARQDDDASIQKTKQ
jgi:hypothetical protein